MHGHIVKSVFCFPFSFFILVFLFYDKGRDTYIYFSRHIMRIRFELFICPTGTEQSILSLTSSYTEMIHG